MKGFIKVQLLIIAFLSFLSLHLFAQERLESIKQIQIDEQQLYSIPDFDPLIHKARKIAGKPDSLLSSFQNRLKDKRDSLILTIKDSLKIFQVSKETTDSITKLQNEANNVIRKTQVVDEPWSKDHILTESGINKATVDVEKYLSF